MLELYYSIESTCGQKVRLNLAEKSLEWRERLLNLRKGEQFAPDYLRLNPKGVVPTLVHDGQVVIESIELLGEDRPQRSFSVGSLLRIRVRGDGESVNRDAVGAWGQ